ncbi:hypothetical protein LTR05_004407 [Lithohypha guttulata]|uniref:Flavin-containing monooxygenase n=1 Tax=Lithohypha guttulata TaxID=1690604 RepID=A0AAN7T1K2_9EURO|nr:hypothetical protein LTR05_004407 [Lithohypha guttulata]
MSEYEAKRSAETQDGLGTERAKPSDTLRKHRPDLDTRVCSDLFSDVPAYTPARKLKVVTVGAGFSGLLFAHKLQHQYPEMQNLIEHNILESRTELGGTWLVNTYPGIQCDVPAHIYAFPFDPNPDWSHFYASGKEIHDYLVKTTKKWNLDRDIRFGTRLQEARWQPDSGQYKLTILCNGKREIEYADVLVSGQGILNNWKWPAIPGLDTFEGHKCHSANWDHNFDYAHKRIAVIGNGSSGIQIVPQMARLQGTQVISFQRKPTYIYYRMPPSKLLNRPNISGNPEYTEEDKKRFRENPAEHRAHRRMLVHRINRAFKMFVKDSPQSVEASRSAREQMAQKLNHDPDLCRKLIPEWSLGCRRITPGEGYLESFLLPNVHLTQSPISKITSNSVITEDGQEYPVDVIACATGFEVSFQPQFKLFGTIDPSTSEPFELGDLWKDEAESYISICAPHMPNYFSFGGPNAVIAHGSLIEAFNWTADYMVKWLRKMATEGLKSVTPKQDAIDEFVAYGEAVHQSLVWTDNCSSWYKKNRVDGRVTAAFGGSAMLYKQLISELRTEDFEIEYRERNRFAFMGNGFMDFEFDDEADLAWYIDR